MKRIFFVLFSCMAMQVCAQQETYDLLSFTPPSGWEKSSKSSGVSFTTQNRAKKSWCTIFLYKSVTGTNDVETDFQNEWQELTVRNHNITSGPQKEPVVKEEGWDILAGGGKGSFNNAEMMVLHTVASGYGLKISMIVISNHTDYLPQIESFISSIKLNKPNGVHNNSDASTPASTASSNLTKHIYKSYQNRKHASGMGDNAGRSTNTYTFNSDGSYNFTNVTFQYHTPKYYLVNESGTYTLNDNALQLQPLKSSWSTHKDKQTDPALQSGKNALTATTFRIEYVTIYDRLRLVLSPIDGKENKRDGSFDYVNNNELQKAYLYDAEERAVSQNNNTSTTSTTSSTIKKSNLKEIWMSVNQVARNTYNYATNSYQYTYDFKPVYYVVYENGSCLNDLPLLGPDNPPAHAKWGKFQLGTNKGSFTDADGKLYELEKISSKELKLKGRIEKHYRCAPVDGLKLHGWYSVHASRTLKEISPGGTYHRETGALIYFDKNGSFDDPGLFVKNKQNPNEDRNTSPGKGTYSISNYTIYLKYTDGRNVVLSFTGFNGDDPVVKNDIVYMSSFPLYKVKN